MDLEAQENKKNILYMDIAKRISQESKDFTTKVGAVIVKDNRILSMGYNGAPKNFPDDDLPVSSDASLPLIEQKNTYMIHAELNSILNYNGYIKNLEGATLYVTVSPCIECAKVLIQVGIKTIYYLEEYHRSEIWNASKKLLDIGGVKYYKF